MDRTISTCTEYFSVVKVGIIVNHITKAVVRYYSHDSRTVLCRIVITERAKGGRKQAVSRISRNLPRCTPKILAWVWSERRVITPRELDLRPHGCTVRPHPDEPKALSA
jgi:hypothetical protein